MNNVTVEKNVNLSEFVQGKSVVVDTSSLLMSGSGLLTIINNCYLIIPAIVVKELEEKRTHSTLGFLSREWLRLLEELRVSKGKELSKGVLLNNFDNITLSVEPNHVNQKSLPEHLQDGSHDSTVLAVARNLQRDKEHTREVVLLSNDAPMRLHSTLDLDIDAYEFNATQIIGAKPFDGRYAIEVDEKEYTDFINEAIFSEDIKTLGDYVENALSDDTAASSVVSLTLHGKNLVDLIRANNTYNILPHKSKASGITARTQEQDVAFTYLKADPNDLTVISLGGSAGTGKTLAVIAVALDELKNNNYQKVMVFRSLHEMGQGQEMGFLPGDVNDKMGPWAGAIHDSLDVIASAKNPRKKNDGPQAEIKRKEEAKKLAECIEIAPITYLRGRSLSNTFIILEEAQNFSRSEILNILSRAGVGSKIVLTFDAAQVDNRFLQPGDKADIWSVIDDLKKEEIFAHITLKKTERSKIAEIASRILES